ncbi:MAG: hypothetical protein K1X88_01070 [Nannocystaceae bacterium]|nr:hypothetical protein [Nannocystaceae bacterium]
MLLAAVGLGVSPRVTATDHNDPDKINSIFPGIEPSAADIYGLMTWPEDSETIAVVLTWADVEYDRDLLYRIYFDAEPGKASGDGFHAADLDVAGLFSALANLVVDEEKVISFRFGRAKQPQPGRPNYAVEMTFEGFELAHPVVRFPVETEVAIPVDDGSGAQILAVVARRDDPFFIDLEGFFTSIWYGHPPGPESTWGVEDKSRVKGLLAYDEQGELVLDAQGQPRFVYDSDRDIQAGRDVHSISLRIPKSLLADDNHPIVNIWSQSLRVGG